MGLAGAGFPSVAAEGFEAPGCGRELYRRGRTSSPERSICRTPACRSRPVCRCSAVKRDDFRTFRVGLFGLDKLKDVDRTVEAFSEVLRHARSVSL